MVHALIFAIKIGLLAAAAVWIAQRPGTIELNWLGYHVTAHVGLALLCLLFAVLLILFLHRLLLALAAWPRRLQAHKKNRQHEKAYRHLTLGLSAVAAGDARFASVQAQKTRDLWPEDRGLSLLLEAQAARLRGEEDVARAAFDKLLKNKDTAFLGVRGLLVHALESGDNKRALDLAHRALKMYPRQPWILRMTYDLEVQGGHWQLAERTLKRAAKLNIIDAKKAGTDRVAMLLAQADEWAAKGEPAKALRAVKAAHHMDRSFVPAAQRLAALYIEKNRKSFAKPVIQECWKSNPHIDLVPLWDMLTPHKKNDGGASRMAWFEKLVALNPGSAEAQIAAGQVAMEQELWGRARDYLNVAEQIQPSARLYRLYATLEEKQGRTEAANEWLEKSADAPPEKVWACTETGRIYERWMPLAQPHGSFNTIVWDYPRARAALGVPSLLPQNELMITAK